MEASALDPVADVTVTEGVSDTDLPAVFNASNPQAYYIISASTLFMTGSVHPQMPALLSVACY